MKIRFLNDTVEIYDLTPNEIGAASDADIDTLTTSLSAALTRIATLEGRPQLKPEYTLVLMTTPPTP